MSEVNPAAFRAMIDAMHAARARRKYQRYSHLFEPYVSNAFLLASAPRSRASLLATIAHMCLLVDVAKGLTTPETDVYRHALEAVFAYFLACVARCLPGRAARVRVVQVQTTQYMVETDIVAWMRAIALLSLGYALKDANARAWKRFRSITLLLCTLCDDFLNHSN